jgi:hypothetical protein
MSSKREQLLREKYYPDEDEFKREIKRIKLHDEHFITYMKNTVRQSQINLKSDEDILANAEEKFKELE